MVRGGRWTGGISLLVGCMVVLGGCRGKTLTNPYADIDESTDADEVPADGSIDAAVDAPIPDPAQDPSGDVDSGPPTCARDKDCENASLGSGETCRERKYCEKPAGVCALTWQTDCCREREILYQGFEHGLGDWTVTDRYPATGPVTWSVTGRRSAFGAGSAYFGDPVCFTYYNGALKPDCTPVNPGGTDATLVRGSLTSPSFFLPPLDPSRTTFYVSFYTWIETEPVVPGAPVQPDLFRLLAVTNPGRSETVTPIASSVAIVRSAGGAFVHGVGDLSAWRNQTIALRLSFDSLDSSSNRYEGVYVDEIRVATGCTEPGASHPACGPEAPCPPDAAACTDDACQVFANAAVEGAGVCEYPPVAGCQEP